MAKNIKTENVQESLIAGVNKAVNAIKRTLGPSGKCVGIDNGGEYPDITRDGATVAKAIKLSDPVEDMGATMVKKAAAYTEELAGDSTTTTSVLIQEMVNKGHHYLVSGSNVNEIKDGMQKAERWVNQYIKDDLVEPVDGDLETIRKVATISANNDPKVGDLITECFEKVGTEGVITVDMSYSLDTTVEISEGMKVERGWLSPSFVTDAESNTCVLDNPYILVTEEKISSMNQLIPILEPLIKSAHPFLIFCDDMDPVVTNTLIINMMRGACKCCVVKGIEFGENRAAVMQDIAIATGATYICKEFGLELIQASMEMIGSAEKVIVGKSNTVIIKGAGEKEAIDNRIKLLDTRIADPNTTKFDKGKYEARKAALAGGIGIIHAGGASEVERVNRKATIEDAILASKSAIAEGVVEGGGTSLLIAGEEAKKFFAKEKLTEDERAGVNIVLNSLKSIVWTVCENAGVSGDVVISNLLGSKKGKGFNAKTKKYVDLTKDGVLDSAKAIRVSLENSVSAASMILLTDCTITETEKNEGCCCCKG